MCASLCRQDLQAQRRREQELAAQREKDMAAQRQLMEQRLAALEQRTQAAEQAQKDAEVRLHMQLRKGPEGRAGANSEVNAELVKQLEASFQQRERLLRVRSWWTPFLPVLGILTIVPTGAIGSPATARHHCCQTSTLAG